MPKPPGREDPVLIKLIGGVLIKIPLGLARGLLKGIEYYVPPRLRKWMLGVVVCGSVACFLSASWFFNFLELLFWEGFLDAQWRAGVHFIAFYGLYVLVMQPVFLALAHVQEQNKDFNQEKRKVEPDSLEMWRCRAKQDGFKTYLGQSVTTGKPVYLTTEQRNLHLLCTGSTGSGKTESVMLPLVANDVKHGRGCIIIDGKGDSDLRDKLYWIVKKCKRENDFYYFGLNHVKDSNTFNPFFSSEEELNPTSQKDLLINSAEWGGEPFYRKMAEQAALTVLSAIRDVGEIPRYRTLYSYLTDATVLKRLADQVTSGVIKSDIGKMVDGFKENRKFLSSMITDLHLMSRSEFSDLLDEGESEINLLELYRTNGIAYFSLDLQKYPDTSRRLGRALVQSIRSLSSYVQANMLMNARHYYGVHIDDAASFLDGTFVDLLNKSRAAKLMLSVYIQSLGDLKIRSAPGFEQQVLENTSNKVSLRVDHPYTAETFSKIGGTRDTTISTYVTQQDQMLGSTGFTGMGSVRTGQTFRIPPDTIKSLARGEAAVIFKNPRLFTDHIKLDWIGEPSYAGIFKPIRGRRHEVEHSSGGKKSNKVFPLEELETKKEGSDPFRRIRELEKKKKSVV